MIGHEEAFREVPNSLFVCPNKTTGFRFKKNQYKKGDL